jgi:TolB-like protein/Tfp pilus assembly protein PilF
MDVRRFLAELKGRGVYRVAAIYTAGSWALLQVADLFFPLLGFPDWAITAVLAAAALGFPMALILAWLFDITPEGIVETDTSDIDVSRLRLSPARIMGITLLVGLVLLVGFLYMERLDLIGKVEQGSASVAVEPGYASIAVIPFVNMSPTKELEYFGDGLAEEILNLLARLTELDVAARTSSFYFKDHSAGIPEIASQLGVRHVLEGSVRRQGNQVRVTAQLIDASNGYHLWSQTYDRDLSNTFGIQDDIARQVVDKLQVILSASSKQILNQRPTLVPAAYDYYLRGREYLREPLGAETLEQAATLFSKAIELDGDYAEAYAGLCDSYLGHYQLTRDPQQFKTAESACQRALSLDSNAAAVYEALGNLYRFSGKYGPALLNYDKALALNPKAVDALDGKAVVYRLDNKPALAEETLLQAIMLQPNYWRFYQSMGAFLFSTGRFQEAIPYYQRITELMPDNAQAFSDLAAAYFMLNRFEAAAETLQQSLALDPTAIAYSNAGASLFFLRRFDEAADMYQKAIEYAPEDYANWGALADAYRFSKNSQELAEPMYVNAIRLASGQLKINSSDVDTLSLLAHYTAAIGQREQALQYIARATALAPNDMYTYYNYALMLTTLGEMDKAIAALETAVALGYSTALLQVDAGFDELRGVPRFEQLTGAN